jgi:murein DD-endopeptidase MepM/ murein hydrolase activator NlpD
VNSGSFPKLHLVLICGLSLFMTVFLFSLASERNAPPADPAGALLELPDLKPPAAVPAPSKTTGVTTEVGIPAPPPSAPAPATEPGAFVKQPRARVTPASLAAIPPLQASGASSPETIALTTSEPVMVPLRVESIPSHDVKTIKVRSGDSLSVIFKREGLSSRDIHRLVTSEPLGKRLKNIFPGQEMTFTRAEDGSLVKLAYTPTALQTLEFERVGNGFNGQELIVKPERSTAYKHGLINQSLFLASQGVGLPDSMTMRLAQIFQWDIDFVLDIRRGDEFHVVYEELYVGEEFVGFGDILAAEFVNQGRSHQAIRYTDAEGRTDYYGPEGRSMRQAFLRAPVEFSRISSNFNLRRVHPLFNRAAPHRGIDYAAPTGTPVLASGDGRVVTASRTEPNGNYVVIQHGERFVTKYLHLSKFGRGIKSGTRVKQGQIIGYVGATGWATGPHLHYEFLVNGVHQNPRTVKLPNAEPIPAKELPLFNQRAKPLLALLEDYKQQVQVAMGH